MKYYIIYKKYVYLISAIIYISILNNTFSQDTVTVCDNGGFEQDFLHYTGDTSSFKYGFGSNDCDPLKADSVTSVSFASTSLPNIRRLEIVSSGFDSLASISKTKFGSKALRINSRYGHADDSCGGYFGIDRIEKEFTVTEETRNFTVWYALVLENPTTGHEDQQPFFSIRCDLASSYDLCFDAAILDCDQAPGNNSCNYDYLDILNWTCHRIKIPKSEIGKTANLEITVSDCAQGGHFGYAYIDGICEDCDSSALGSAHLDSIVYTCVPDTARICGTYNLPDVCNKSWDIKELSVPGYTISDVLFDKTNKTYCFDFPESNFGTDTCVELFTKVIYTDGLTDLPAVISNSIVICESQLDTIEYSASVGDCNDNNTATNLSDDYYYVSYDLTNTNGYPWTIERKLDNPYPDEDGTHTIASGTGDASGDLGFFLIQEASWTMIITINDDCVYEIDITPPNYCGDCTEFNDLTISNISRDCNGGAPGEWSFDLYVPGPTGGSFTLNGNTEDFNETISISIDPIAPTCNDFSLVYSPIGSSQCNSKITVCPPKPCKTPSCDLEVYVKSVPCTKNIITGVVTFSVELDVTGSNLCYSVDGSTPVTLPGSQIIGT